MNTYKIIHTKDIGEPTYYTIVHAESETEALDKVKPGILLDIVDHGEKREDIFQEWFETWSNKVKNHRETIQHEIRQIKSPSKKVKK